MNRHWQDAEKVVLLTRPALARRDAPFPMHRSRLAKILNGDPAASPTRRRAQTWCSLFVAPCAPEGTPPVSTRLRPCWTAFLSILREPDDLLCSRNARPRKALASANGTSWEIACEASGGRAGEKYLPVGGRVRKSRASGRSILRLQDDFLSSLHYCGQWLTR